MNVDYIIFSPLGGLTNENLLREIGIAREKGEMTQGLSEYCVEIIDLYSKRSQWRGYRLINEMKIDALATLNKYAMKIPTPNNPYGECTYTNPIGYFHTIIKTCFITFLEKKKQEYIKHKGDFPCGI